MYCSASATLWMKSLCFMIAIQFDSNSVCSACISSLWRAFMTETRKEKDSLGFVEVPADALYGAQTARAVVNFPISGLRASPFLITALAMVKRAAAEANQELGLITMEHGSSIIE